jgi:predicted nucleic acid-binding protein
MEEALVLCDTNILIDWYKNDAPTIVLLEKIGLNKIALSSITKMELLRGCRNKNELRKQEQRFKHYPIVHFDREVSFLAIQFVSKFKLSHNIQIPDAIIGASAIRFKLPLFTYNTKDFEFLPGINLYKPYGMNTIRF